LPQGGYVLFEIKDGSVDVKGFDLNFGIGHWLRNASDQWVAKAIIAFPFK